MIDFTQTELWAIYDNNEDLFLDLLQVWCSGDYYLCKDNYEEMRDKFIDSAESDEFTNEIDTFGILQETPLAPDFHKKYFCLYTDVSNATFCPSVPDKCSGCEKNEKKDMSYIEMVYNISDGLRVEANYYYPNYDYSIVKNTALSTCCLAELIDRPSGFYCRDCEEER